jgi:hypothetical protein
MNIGIVGSEGAKFTALGEERAKKAIHKLIEDRTADDEIPTIISGECHLGGIDIWAKEIALDWNCGYIGYAPRELNWNNGYKPRNLQIAHNSDKVVCITVDSLPANYDGMKFPKGCYHCQKAGRPHLDHIKSGGCWTVLQAIKKGKIGEWITIPND